MVRGLMVANNSRPSGAEVLSENVKINKLAEETGENEWMDVKSPLSTESRQPVASIPSEP